MPARVRIRLVQHVTGIGVDDDIRVGRSLRRIARQREYSSNKTAHAQTKPMRGSGPDPQHDISPVLVPLVLRPEHRHPCRAEVERLDEAKKAVF